MWLGCLAVRPLVNFREVSWWLSGALPPDGRVPCWVVVLFLFFFPFLVLVLLPRQAVALVLGFVFLLLWNTNPLFQKKGKKKKTMFYIQTERLTYGTFCTQINIPKFGTQIQSRSRRREVDRTH